MLRKINAKFHNGKLEPLEELHLQEGENVTIFIVEDHKSERDEEAKTAFERSAGGWVGLIDFDEFLEDLRESRKRISPPVDLDL